MRHGLQFALAHPRLAAKVALRRLTAEEAYARVLEQELGPVPDRYRLLVAPYVRLDSSPPLLQQAVLELAGIPRYSHVHAMNGWTAFLYLATRKLRPSLVVETGVLYGYSSAAILRAMHDNHKGRLISIDLPAGMHRERLLNGDKVAIGVKRSQMVGSAVPEHLRDRWELVLGDSIAVLEDALPRWGEVSMFIHDSHHTYAHMTAEYHLAARALAEGGLLVSDDVQMNAAWPDFCRLRGLTETRLAKDPEGRRQFAFAEWRAG